MVGAIKRFGAARKARSPREAGLVVVREVSDDDLLSPGRTRLSSARARFTVLFEMGRSGSTPLWSSDVTEVRDQVSGIRYENPERMREK